MEENNNSKTLLSRIRENIGLVVFVVAISLLAFILGDLITGTNRMNTGNQGSIGEIGGEDIAKTDFDKKFALREALAQRNGQTMGEEERSQLQDGIWATLVSEKIYGKQYESLGLSVSPEELQDMFTGKNISPAVKQYFDGFFKQNNKAFNTEDVKKYLTQAVNDPAEKVNLKEFEDYLYNYRLREKFENMVAAGYTSSKAQAVRKNIDQNKKFNFSFLGVNYSQIADSTLKVEDSELLAYMSKHSARFQQEDQTIVKFVQYDLKASKEDSLAAYNNVLKWKTKFAEAKDDSLFAAGRTRKGFNPKGYVSLKDIPGAAKDSVKLVAKGTVFGPVLDADAYKLFKLIDAKKGDIVNAKLRQIVFMVQSPTPADSAAAFAKAIAAKSTVNAANFAAKAGELSEDMQTKMSGGSMNWVSTPSQYGKAFDDAVKGAGKGAIVGPIKTPQGFHLLLVEDKTDETFLVAEVEKQILVGPNTAKGVSELINAFSTKAIAAKSIDSAGKVNNVPVRTSDGLKNNDKKLMGMPARALILWALSNNVGDFSQVYTIGDSYVFAQISKKQKKGLMDLEDARPMVLKDVLNEKKGKLIADKLAGLQGKSLEEMKTTYGAGAFVSSASDITFESGNIPGVGADPYIIGKLVGMAKGTTSKPIVGKNGVYVLQVTDIKDATPLDDAAIKANKKGAASAGQSAMRGKIATALEKIADIKDDRWKMGL